MDSLTIILLIIVLLCIWRGYVRGLFQTLVIAGAMILAMVLSAYACPYVSKVLQDRTKLDERIEASIIERLELDMTQAIQTKNEEMQMIDRLPFPNAIKMAVVNNNNSDVYEGFQVQSFQEYLAHYLKCVVINCLSYIIVQVVFTVGFLILIHVTKLLTEIPILHGIDKAGGVLLGMIQALVIIWTFFVLISLIGNTPLGMYAFAQINSNPALDFLYEHNLLMNTMTDVTKIIFS